MSLVIENKIKQYIKERKIVKPIEVVDYFGLSKSTSRRYLIKLENEGFLKRNFGEVIYNEIALQSEKVALQNINVNPRVKQSIAQAASILAKDYTTIYVDGGSTCYYLIEKLNPNINLYTNSIYNALHAIELGFKNVTVIGGKVKINTLSMTDTDLKHLNNLSFQAAFLGVKGIDKEGNLSTSDVSEGIMKNFIVNHSELVVVLAEKEKFGIRSFYNFTPENKMVLVVSDIKKQLKTSKNLYIIKTLE